MRLLSYDTGNGPRCGVIQGDDIVDVDDLIALIGAWGACDDCNSDVNNDGQVTVGTPTVENASVVGEVVEAERKDKKLIIFKMKRRKGYRNKNGHRQRHSIIKITDIKA